MKKLFFQAMLGTLLIFFASCKKDNLKETPPTQNQPKTYSDFVIENEALDKDYPYYRYVMLTNQDGEILYETIKPEKTAHIVAKVADGDIVDLTVLDYRDSNIFTFRNIKSGFHLRAFSSPFFEYCLGDFSEGVKLNLKITGISDYDELYFGLQYQDIISKYDNSISLGMSYYLKHDRTLTIRPKGSNEYLSYLVRFDDLNFTSYNNATKEISIDDFKPSYIYQVAVSEKGKYSGDLIMWHGDKFAFTNREKGYKDLNKGEKLKFYVSPELINDMKELDIVKKNDKNIRSKKILSDNFLETVSIGSSNIDIDANGTSYNYSSSTDFDLGWVYYTISDSKTFYFYWNVFQSGNDKVSYKLPALKEDVLSQNRRAFLKTPKRIQFETYKFEMGMENLDIVFDMCRNYESTYVSKDL